MPDNKAISIDDDQFAHEVLDCQGLSLVYFWSPRCGPCHQMAPSLEAFAQDNAERVKVFKIDVDDNPKTVEKYNIRSTPTLIFFKDGAHLETKPGAMSQTALQAKIDTLIN
jgi:thioredoxin 1